MAFIDNVAGQWALMGCSKDEAVNGVLATLRASEVV